MPPTIKERVARRIGGARAYVVAGARVHISHARARVAAHFQAVKKAEASAASLATALKELEVAEQHVTAVEQENMNLKADNAALMKKLERLAPKKKAKRVRK